MIPNEFFGGYRDHRYEKKINYGRQRRPRKWFGMGWDGMGVRTSQMKVTRSCQGAFLGSRAPAAIFAMTAMPATPAKE
jgi:hypothetical protein